ncbi:pyruvate dehydrogenase complex dihydrolipoamide acetyltransferase [Amorphus orientalis]|uniref:Acetyltransferase component of pyruvate dehydrogenase complex n=1 Tax=Amorphus orientalis TaxID=649198 RepID=A0AAE3VNH5_9HYPH|nr:pyruvate dehydrogenase complex dihydrolipoamide acetyltransferase [Amorphus orientalis]MDQ0315849.1 pyruvate dehydrogenase E2 component (dihydrolipoamide acetyltransferase) [Amorphus orientalis]
MPTPILMPALSPTMEAGNLAKWHVKEGDTVSAGDVVAEIETDKATMEVEAVDEGTVGKILVAEGTNDVPVNEPIAMLLEEGEDASALENADTSAPAPAAKEEAKAEPAESKAETKSEPAAPQGAKVPAAGEGVSPSVPSAAPKANGDGRVFSSPLARRLADENGIDLSRLSGSGPHGRVVKRDVEKALKEGVPAAAEAPKADKSAPASAGGAPSAPAPAGMTDDQIRAMYKEGSFSELPHDGMRKTIARRLVEAKQTVPHFYLTIDTELDALLKMRKELNDAAPTDKDGKPAYKLSVNDFIIKALARALVAVPMANATYTSTARLMHEHVDVGVAVAIPDGLITPVVREADLKPLSVISNEVKDLAKRARDKKLKPEEYQGGVTSVSNLGMYGIRDFGAVINPPQSTILAVGQGEERAVVKDGALAIATVMTVTLSVDHRAVDGALGAELLAAFKPLIENPLSMLV